MPIIDVENLTSTQVAQLAQAECKRLGYKLLNIKEAEHSADNYIRYVIAHNEDDEQYAVWLFNVQMGGFYHGGYHNYSKYVSTTKDKARQFAMQDFNQRK